jgi:hypothetical protein
MCISMKFSKHFSSEMTTLPQALQDHLIDYKRYKKYIKSCASISEFIEKVSRDAVHYVGIITLSLDTRSSLFEAWLEILISSFDNRK